MSTWYARRVNGMTTGIVSRREAEVMSRAPLVSGDLKTGLTWHERDPAAHGGGHTFEFMPITDEEAAEWL